MYFFIALTPPARIFCRIAFRGFPSICRRTRESMNPNSEGRSGRSLLERSNVFSFCNFTMSPEIFLILLSLRIKIDRLGHRSKSLNSVSLLKERAIVSSLSEEGISAKLESLFSLSSSRIKLFVCAKAPLPMLSMQFLFNTTCSSLLHLRNTSDGIWEILLLPASILFKFYPRTGSYFNLLSLRRRTYKVLIAVKSGIEAIAFYERFRSTSALHPAYSLGTAVSLFREKSSNFKLCIEVRHIGKEASRLFLKRRSCKSTKTAICSGMIVIWLLEKSILVSATQSHQFWSSKGNYSRRNN